MSRVKKSKTKEELLIQGVTQIEYFGVSKKSYSSDQHIRSMI